MKPIKIITDTASDITLEIAKEYDIELLPLHIGFGDEEYLDQYEMTAQEFYEKLEQSDVHPKTALVSIAQHTDAFMKYADDYTIIYVPISAKGSGTYQAANLAKETVLDEKENAEIYIFENDQYSYGYGLWVIEGAKMARNGKTADEILAMLNEKIHNTHVILTVSTLDYLQKGGRISSTSKLIANVLDITPILEIKDGLVESKEKVRGSKKVIAKMAAIVKENALEDPKQEICVMHANAPETANKIIDKLKETTNFTNFTTGYLGPIVGVHTGPGAFGIVYQKKN